MTGTERAGARLALGILRAHPREGYSATSCVEAAVTALRLAGLGRVSAPASDALCVALFNTGDRWSLATRLVAARLALYLRTVLRAEADDRYAADWSWPADHKHWTGVCDKCREPVPRYYKGERIESGRCAGALVRHPRPLWLDAPPAGTPRRSP